VTDDGDTENWLLLSDAVTVISENGLSETRFHCGPALPLVMVVTGSVHNSIGVFETVIYRSPGPLQLGLSKVKLMT